MLLQVAAALFERGRSRLETFYPGRPWDGVVGLPVDRQGAAKTELVSMQTQLDEACGERQEACLPK